MYESEIYLPNPDFDISENLIYRWQQYGSMTQDSYPEYHIAAMMVLISHLIKSEMPLKFGAVRNNMWGIILGSSGTSGKSTACNALMATTYTEELSPYVHHLTGKTTAPALLLSLTENPNRLHYFDEATGFLKTLEREYNTDLGMDWIRAYDGTPLSERVIGKSRDTSKPVTVSNPRLAILWATTLDSFSENAKRDQFTSGFFLRPFFIIQTRNKPVMEDDETDQAVADFKEEIILKLANLCHLIRGRKVRFFKSKSIAKWKQILRAERNDPGNYRSDIEDSAMNRIYELAYKTAMNLTLGSKEFYEYMEKESKAEGNLIGVADITYEIPEHIAKFACEIAEQYFFPTNLRAYKLTTEKGDYSKIIKIFKEGGHLSITQMGDVIKKSGRRTREILSDLREDYPIAEFKDRTPGSKKYTTYYGLEKPVN